MSDKIIYLAGPIHGRSDAECNTWRDLARVLWSGLTLDPMRRDARGKESDPRVIKEVVEADKEDILKCDGVLVYFVIPSVGTSMEILWAWLLRKPIALVNASQAPLSLWLSYHCSIFPDLTSAIKFLETATNSESQTS